MPVFTRPIHEHGTPGQPDYPHSPPGKGKRPRPGRSPQGSGYKITFRSQDPTDRGMSARYFTTGLSRVLQQELTLDEQRKLKSARVILRFDDWATAQLGAPLHWQAPNGVMVIYLRGQRRNERTGSGTYHDFNASSMEAVVPLTRNVGPGRRALRAWAKEFIEDKSVVRFKARQLVRPGD
ncbi:MAG TPA: hypothetical protein VFP27_02390 [Mycobacterium sp.]|nr:hypothetical protein [Mycobacterium sp.]